MAHRGRHNADPTLVLALACGATAQSAAAKAGVAVRTVHRRLKDPAFLLRVQQLRSEMVQRTAASLTAASLESVKTLLSLQQPTVADGVRLGAARAVLEMAMRLRGAADLEQRLAALEAQLLGAEPEG